MSLSVQTTQIRFMYFGSKVIWKINNITTYGLLHLLWPVCPLKFRETNELSVCVDTFWTEQHNSFQHRRFTGSGSIFLLLCLGNSGEYHRQFLNHLKI